MILIRETTEGDGSNTLELIRIHPEHERRVLTLPVNVLVRQPNCMGWSFSTLGSSLEASEVENNQLGTGYFDLGGGRHLILAAGTVVAATRSKVARTWLAITADCGGKAISFSSRPRGEKDSLSATVCLKSLIDD